MRIMRSKQKQHFHPIYSLGFYVSLTCSPSALKLEVGSWEGTQPGQLTQNWPKVFFKLCDICSGKKSKWKEEGWHLLLWHFSSRAITAHTEVLLPRKWPDITCWWEAENKSCFPLLSCPVFPFSLLNCRSRECKQVVSLPFSWHTNVFSILFSPPCVLMKISEIEWLGGQLASSQGQSTTLLKHCLPPLLPLLHFLNTCVWLQRQGEKNLFCQRRASSLTWGFHC